VRQAPGNITIASMPLVREEILILKSDVEEKAWRC